MLDEGRRTRLTLVSAPAGFDKATLLARWLAASSDLHRSVGWLSLPAVAPVILAGTDGN